jgi:hypothetical protein
MVKETFEDFKQTNPQYSLKPLEDQVEEWASFSIAEQMPYSLGNAFWCSPQAQLFFDQIESYKRRTVVLTGSHGVGKTAMLLEMCNKLKDNYTKCWFISTSESANTDDSLQSTIERFIQNEGNSLTTNGRYLIIIDTPYHSRPYKTTLRRDWKAINNLDFLTFTHSVTLILSIAEVWLYHWFVNFSQKFHLNDLQPSDLLSAYKNIWHTSDPFTDETLLRLGELSSGKFRKFMDFIAICLKNKKALGINSPITKEFVDTSTVNYRILTVLESELSKLFKQHQRKRAIRASKITEIIINSKEELNQKQIAQKIDVSEASVSRIINFLIANNNRFSVNFEKTIGAHGQAFVGWKMK